MNNCHINKHEPEDRSCWETAYHRRVCVTGYFMEPRGDWPWFGSRCSLSVVPTRHVAYAGCSVVAADARLQHHISLQSEGDAYPAAPPAALQHHGGAHRLGHSLLHRARHSTLWKNYGTRYYTKYLCIHNFLFACLYTFYSASIKFKPMHMCFI